MDAPSDQRPSTIRPLNNKRALASEVKLFIIQSQKDGSLKRLSSLVVTTNLRKALKNALSSQLLMTHLNCKLCKKEVMSSK